VINADWVIHLLPDELEAQLCGQVKISLDDWKANTEYKGFILGSYSPIVLWFW